MNKLKLGVTSLIALILAGCATTSEQGHALTPELIKQIKTGMSKDDVLKVLGPPQQSTPMAWAYVHAVSTMGYGFLSSSGKVSTRTVSIIFNGNTVRSCTYAVSEGGSSGLFSAGVFAGMNAAGNRHEVNCSDIQDAERLTAKEK